MEVLALLGWVAIIVTLNRFADFIPARIRGIIHWLRAQTLELFSLLGVILWRLATLLKGNKFVGSGKGRPILLIHGYLNGAFVWDFQKWWLAKKGFGPIYAIDLGYPFDSIRTYAQKVERMAKKIAEETEGKPLTLIGHSMGGIVAAVYATQLAPKKSLAAVMTIGSPLKGTHMAKIGFGRCVREMEIGSELIQSLQNAIRERVDLCFYHIATKTDQLVIPYSSCFLKSTPKERTTLFEDIGHASLLFSPRVARQLSKWLPL